MKEQLSSYKEDIKNFFYNRSEIGELRRAEALRRWGKCVYYSSIFLESGAAMFSLNFFSTDPLRTILTYSGSMTLFIASILTVDEIEIPNEQRIVELRSKIGLPLD